MFTGLIRENVLFLFAKYIKLYVKLVAITYKGTLFMLIKEKNYSIERT